MYTLVYVSIVMTNSHKFGEALTAYFKCELSGHVPDKCDRSEFEQYKHPCICKCNFKYFAGSLPYQYSKLRFEV